MKEDDDSFPGVSGSVAVAAAGSASEWRRKEMNEVFPQFLAPMTSMLRMGQLSDWLHASKTVKENLLETSMAPENPCFHLLYPLSFGTD